MSRSLWEPDFGRVLKVLHREGEPDRVPFLELFHDREIMAAALERPLPADPDEWRRFRLDFSLRFAYDYVVGYHTIGFPGVEALVGEDTAELSRGSRGWQDEHRGPISDWESFERYPWPEVTADKFEDIEKLAPLLPEGMKLTITLPGGILENLSRLLGYEPLCLLLVDDPELVQATVDRIGETELAIYEQVTSYEHVGAVWLNDDLGFKTQTMISPRYLRQFVFPWHQRLTALAHQRGKPVMLHACGNLRDVIEDIIEEVRVDARHSFEDVIMPVAEFKRLYGHRLAVLGGIDVDILARGSVEEVRAYTRRTIEACAPGGGWTLGSGNSVANYIPVGNFIAMLAEGREVGVYGA
jgi:uroporphyrinogen decarboxylase